MITSDNLEQIRFIEHSVHRKNAIVNNEVQYEKKSLLSNLLIEVYINTQCNNLFTLIIEWTA